MAIKKTYVIRSMIFQNYWNEEANMFVNYVLATTFNTYNEAETKITNGNIDEDVEIIEVITPLT